MKKILLIFCVTLLFASCKKEGILEPTSFMVEETVITLPSTGGEYLIPIHTNAPSVEVSVPESAQDWLSAKIEDGNLVLTYDDYAALNRRTASVAIHVTARTDSYVKVTQYALPMETLAIKSAKTNSAQNASGTADAVDGCYDDVESTNWHTNWGTGVHNNPVVYWLLFDLKPGAPSLDGVFMLPRQAAGNANGRFSKFGIWVKGDGTDTPSINPSDTDDSGKFVDGDNSSGWGGLIGSVDEDGFKLVGKGDLKGYPYNAALVVDGVNPFNNPVYVETVHVNNPTQVLIRIPGGKDGDIFINSVGGYAALSEIVFFSRI